MTELLTAAQMRAIEQAAIAAGEVTGLELMERAGKGVVEAIFEEWPELKATSHRAVVLCGPGNNGGDGFVVARLLKDWGWEVEVFLYGKPVKLPPDARVNYERWGELGEVGVLSERNFRDSSGNRLGAVVVDALFGTGLCRPLDEELLKLIRHLSGVNGDSYRDLLVSVDLPSGLCADSGKQIVNELPVELRGLLERQSQKNSTNYLESFASLTVTFDSPKAGHFLGLGPQSCGRVVIKDIGLEGWRISDISGENQMSRTALRPPKLRLVKEKPRVSDRRQFLSSGVALGLPKNNYNSYKYSHGHALILAGGPGKTGAARLAARGALRIGAGLVTLACPRNSFSEVANQVTAIMCRGLDGPPGLRELLEDDRLNALCLGPGMGLGADTQALVIEALKSGRKIVLDADALMRFERTPETLFNLLHEDCVITPHGGEFARLFPDIAEKLNAPATTGPAYSKVDATREAAARAGCVVLFKGPDTVIATPDGCASINSSAYERAAPWLATAGSGDVLAGFITGLLARGFAPQQAAETAAWLHMECALSFGPGLIAEDLPEELPKVFKALFVDS